MDPRALHKLSYGLYIVTSRKGDRYNGQIANTVFQISSEPVTVAVSINKKNLTNEFIAESRQFVASVLSQEASLSLIGQFGFKSGREVDKLSGVNHRFGRSGIPYITESTIAYIEAEVTMDVDAGTHTIFVGRVTEGEVLKDGIPMTYAYYQEIKRGSVPRTAPTFVEKTERESKPDKYVCSVCGYVYDPEAGDPERGIPAGTPFEDLASDWTCPVCGVGKESFSRVT